MEPTPPPTNKSGNWKYVIEFLAGFASQVVGPMMKGTAPGVADMWMGFGWGILGTGLVNWKSPKQDQ